MQRYCAPACLRWPWTEQTYGLAFGRDDSQSWRARICGVRVRPLLTCRHRATRSPGPLAFDDAIRREFIAATRHRDLREAASAAGKGACCSNRPRPAIKHRRAMQARAATGRSALRRGKRILRCGISLRARFGDTVQRLRLDFQADDEEAFLGGRAGRCCARRLPGGVHRHLRSPRSRGGGGRGRR